MPTPFESEIISICTQAGGILGLLGFFGICYLYFKTPKEFSGARGYITIALTFSDFIGSVVKLIGQAGQRAGSASILCRAQAVFIQYGNLPSILLNFLMSLIIINVLITQNFVHVTRKREVLAIALCFIIPIFPSLYVLTNGSDGLPLIAPRSQWCWISARYRDMQIALFFGWLWFIFIFNLETLIA